MRFSSRSTLSIIPAPVLHELHTHPRRAPTAASRRFLSTSSAYLSTSRFSAQSIIEPLFAHLSWRGSIWHFGGVGIRRLRASRRSKSDRARPHAVVSNVRIKPDCDQGSDSAVALLGWLACTTRITARYSCEDSVGKLNYPHPNGENSPP